MSKGLYTQTFVVLMREAISIESVAAVLADFSPSAAQPAAADVFTCGPSIQLEIDDQDAGKVVVDVVDQIWPDDPTTAADPSRIARAYQEGQLGPFTAPESLLRATQQSWNWEAGRTATKLHQAFIRIRCSYVLDGNATPPNLPENYDPYNELAFMTEVVGMLLELPEAICYFNPGGEVLSDLEVLTESAEFSVEHSLPPVELWANMRFHEFDPQWSVMDTVGHIQLDIPDMEGCFRPQDYDAEEVENFLRDVGIYLLQNGDVIKDGETSEGPGEILWVARVRESALNGPRRRVLRWFADDGEAIPKSLLRK
ncbi:DUF4261 domain-containing protein [Novipirellula sp.]|uniref:DUF4261 domain-containing protein n=1 Tax=Novipirellula sp. TaxID=2795430 RepID=UPI0035679EC3